MEFDSSYINTTPGKYKITCLTLGAIGLLALRISSTGPAGQYDYLASLAFLVTLIVLLLLICVASLRQSALVLKIEVVICLVLTICYIVATIDVCQIAWHWLFKNFQLGHAIGSLIAAICSVFATLTYISDTALKCREVSGSGSTSNV